MSTLERAAVQRLITQATELGADIPSEICAILGRAGEHSSYPARRWAELHPDDDGNGCCWGVVIRGPERCTCWVPEFDTEQSTELRPLTGPDDLEVRWRMCGDCAFRRDSPERREEWLAEELLSLPGRGVPFWCHEGMRRPARWRHPDGRVVEGSPDDWQPPALAGIPYRLDGRPGLLCAGWAAHAVAARRTGEAS